MSYLTCPSCKFTVSEMGARSPFQNCPRCLLRRGTRRMMEFTTTPPQRFQPRPLAGLERIVEAKSRLSSPHRDVRSG